ncbi:MAG: tRNA threonylcarbamoyladenosine dehydratase [Peptococcaceae bacterium]|nr:tRNA threonylcarbamoyladenosine dehydratase [Peptococcaceae bacterium]
MDRFIRTSSLIGDRAMELLAGSKVAVFGLGGVGSFATEALARAGIGSFILIDYDQVAPSNINRQLHALENTIGRSKTDLMEERIIGINPTAKVTTHCRRYTLENRDSFFTEKPDYVVDAIDDVKGKIDLILYCLDNGISVVSSMGAANKLDPTLFRVDDISRTSVCPLAKTIRKGLRTEGINKGLKVVFSTEQPIKSKTESESRRCSLGSISFVPPVAGMILAGVVIKDLAVL